jgi:hypothetical protein
MIVSISSFSQNVGINSTGAAPNTNAGLDVDFTNKGILIPRIALTSTSSFAPLSAHVAGMLVYNTATAGDVVPGFYYNTGSVWVPSFAAGSATGAMLYWSGTAWVEIPAGSPGQFLQVSPGGTPFWASVPYATLTTTAATAITITGATTGGNITSDGGLTVLSRGICYGLTSNPTTANSTVVASPAAGTGSFSCNITGLLSGTTYHVRAYAVNNAVTSYGAEISFTTLANSPTLAATTTASAITGNSASSGGTITADGGAPVTERGIVFGKVSTPTIVSGTKVIDGSTGTGSFTSSLTGLTGGTLYYVRAYATNSVGTAYGAQVSFTTTVVPPTLVTVAATSITGDSAQSGGSMSWNGGGYSNYMNVGVAISTSQNSATPTYFVNSANYSVNPAVNVTPWTTNLTGLTANTTYYVRSCIQVFRSGWSYVYGDELSFTTVGGTAPVIATTTAISGLSASAANTGGTITSDGGSAITVKGVCWGTSLNPVVGTGNFTTNGTGTGAFGSSITGLTSSTTYHVRSYATNSTGTSYGPDVQFTTWVQAAYNVGDFAGGGRVFHINSDGSVLVAALADQSTNTVWGCSGTTIGTSAALGTGAANTTAILSGCATRPIAASAARACTDGSYNDWYLPSQTELGLLVNSGYLFPPGGVSYYCSSSESSATAVSGYYYANNWQGSGFVKTTQFTVRAIRSIGAPTLATVTTTAVTNISGTTATGGGNVTNDGGAPILAAGICWKTSSGPTIADSKTNDATATGSFISNLTGLTFPTTYYVRAYVTNAAGTSYGSEVSFTTITVGLATVTTDAITNLLGTSVTTGGNVTADGGSAVISRGVCWDTNPNPDATLLGTIIYDVSGGLGTFVSNLTGLTNGQQYYVRAFAINGAGIAYGSDVVFTPIGNSTPILTTVSVTSPTPTGGISGGDIINDGGDPIIVSGICWSATNYPPSIADNKTTDGILTTGTFVSSLTGLIAGTQYDIRAYATNSLGTAYGNEIFYIPVGLPTLAISPLAYNPLDTFAQLPISISNTGGGTLSAYGVVWGTTAGPTIASHQGITVEDINNYWATQNALISPLINDGSVTYYIRGYATSEAGTIYGTEITLIPGGISLPTVSTDGVYNKIGSIAEVGGTILSDGGDVISAGGLVWSTTANPDIISNKIGMSTFWNGLGGYSDYVTGLTIGTTYHVRVYATNSSGTAYGADLSFVATAATVGQVISSPYGSGANVFSIDGTGLHGLMAYPFEYLATDWGCTSTTVGTTGTNVGTGLTNTTDIINDIALNSCSSAFSGAPNYYAFAPEIAQWFGADWYLPSKDEFTLLKTNSVAAGIDMSMATYPIWSSSEVDATHAWSFDGTNWVSSLKTSQNMVWVIRSF